MYNQENRQGSLILYMHLTKKVIILFLLSLISIGSAQAYIVKDPHWGIGQKAKIIKYLLSTIVWPDSTVKDNALKVCMVGKFVNTKPIDELNGNVINNRKILVSKKSFKQSQTDCQLVYISNSEKDNVNVIVKKFLGKPVLVISDIGNFADLGGSMNFVETSSFVALTVNIETVKKSNLIFDLNAFKHITVIPKKTDLAE